MIKFPICLYVMHARMRNRLVWSFPLSKPLIPLSVPIYLNMFILMCGFLLLCLLMVVIDISFHEKCLFFMRFCHTPTCEATFRRPTSWHVLAVPSEVEPSGWFRDSCCHCLHVLIVFNLFGCFLHLPFASCYGHRCPPASPHL